MKQILGLISALVLLINWSASSDVKVHSCLPGTSGICILNRVFYNRSHAATHVFPRNQTYIRIGAETWLRGSDSLIKEFGNELYQALGEPHSLEIMKVEMKTLLIPRELVHGDFTNNGLTMFSIASGNLEPKLTYLDLGRNSISNLTNITAFVNLETLYLFNNELETIETSLFQNLTKLRYLNLNYNSIHEIVGDHLPQSLTYLGLFFNQLKTLDFSSLKLPSLETLDIERNQLESISVSVIRLAMPNIKMVLISGNKLSREAFLTTVDTLKRNNISYQNKCDMVWCYDHEELVEGVCMERQLPKTGWIKPTLLSLFTVVVAGVFVFLVRWVFLAMNK